MNGSRSVTPLVLTYNEEPNIGRTLEALAWAESVVVVDSGSTDRTEAIARSHANVQWFVRPFDTHQQQWSYGIWSTGITTPYVLALDADYQVPPAFVRELDGPFAARDYAGGIAGFDYQVLGRTLAGSVYPAKLVLFRADRVTVAQPGHSQEMRVEGPLYRFTARLVHDDRKPIARFVSSQVSYAKLEAGRISRGHGLRWQDRLRRAGVMPVIVGPVAYAKAGGPLAGLAALRYAWERVLFECLLAMEVLGARTAGTDTERPAVLTSSMQSHEGAPPVAPPGSRRQKEQHG